MAEINADKVPKVIAYYLPQYHAIPENDRAWGKGFTEWTNTRKARPLFDGHYQPRIPLHEDYYDLTDVSVMVRQSELAQKYGVFGFCYYHYWFKDGEKLLEKPVEQMLADSRVTIPFCLSWANENWSKLWDGGNREMIMEQEYGGKDEWKKHLEYLVPFFKDSRYITMDGKPVFLIYKPEIIPDVQKMMSYWQSLAQSYGFPGICFMIQNCGSYFTPEYNLDGFDYQIKFPPFFSTVYNSKNMRRVQQSQRIFGTLCKVGLKKPVHSLLGAIRQKRLERRRMQKNTEQSRVAYDQVWEALLQSESTPRMIEGAVTDWDNTARKVNGLMLTGASPERFEYYMTRLFEKLKSGVQRPVVFLNAWNEWGEGAYLEPDERYQYRYLEAISNALKKTGEFPW